MAERKPKLVEYEGKQVSYARAKYLETLKQEAILRQVNEIVMDTATRSVSTGATLGQQDYGGLLRSIVPQLLDQYGTVNAKAAMDFYDNSRLLYAKAYGSQANREVSRSSARARANRYATAVTKSAVSLGQMSFEEFQARFAADYKLAEKSERVIGYAMKVRAESGHKPSVDAMNKAMTREVASYHHDTILFNSALDPFVERVQRVAQASACEFCRMMALGSTDGRVRVSTYAIKFHDNCHCTIQPLYAGEDPVRPPYYDDFEKQYKDATKEVGSRDYRDVVREMRRIRPAGTDKVLPKAAPQAELPKFDLASFMSADKDQRIAAINEVFQGRDFAGFKVEYTSSRGPKDYLAIVKGDIIGPDGGDAGTIERWFDRDADGSIFVKHELLSLERRYRGQGFSTEFSKFSEDFYRSIGIKKIKIDAGLEDGAYTWAKAGYTWRTGSEPVVISKEKIWDLEERGLTKEAERLRAIREVMDNYTIDYENYPQPFELANMQGPEIDGMPFGRWLLHKEYWEGEKKL
jgi:GNAT superfamily N-acetyltransferase